MLIQPLSHVNSFSKIFFTIFRNVGIGVQDWGLGFKCLSLVANQDLESGIHLSIIQDIEFPDMILKFISGSGMNLQRNHVPAVRTLISIYSFSLINLCWVI